MTWKIFTLSIVWFIVSLFWIVFCSVQDKEWWIGQGEIKNICDLMSYIENDDIRDVGVFYSLPIFFPAIYVIIIKRKRDWFVCLTTILISGYWLWQFFLRYQFCL